MKLLGEYALAQGHSQESLARELQRRFDLNVNGANVYSHITSSAPKPDTIERYAKIVGYHDDQAEILARGALSEARLKHWEELVLREFTVFKARWKSGAEAAVRKVLRHDPIARARALSAAAMHWNNHSLSIPAWATVETSVRAFAAELFPALDLREFVRQRRLGDGVLFSIYTEVAPLYDRDKAPHVQQTADEYLTNKKALAFVDACEAMLRLDGIDTRPMRESLTNDLDEIRAIYNLHKNGNAL